MSINRFETIPFPKYPLNNVTPFTYRDGLTFLEVIEALRRHVNEVIVPTLDGNTELITAELGNMHTQFIADLADYNQTIVNSVAEFQQIHDAYMADVNASLAALNDAAVASLVSTQSSALRQSLNDSFAEWSSGVEYWVSPSGSDTLGDGSQNNPFATFTHAIEAGLAHPIRKNETIDIRLFPTIYYAIDNARPAFPETMPFNTHIRFIGADVGGHPNIPTTQFHDYNEIVFWCRNKNLKLTLQDIKFVDCVTGAATNYAHLETINVHAERCDIGVRNTNGVLTVKGGIFTECRQGVTSFQVNRHEIGEQLAGDTNLGPWFRNCDIGVRLQEVVTGHVDYCLFEDCGVGIDLTRGAQVNPDGSEFYRCGTGIRASNASHTLFSDARPQVWGTGVNANEKNLHIVNNSSTSGAPHWTDISNSDSLTETFIRSIDGGNLYTGPFSETIRRDILTNILFSDAYPSGSTLSAKKSLRMRVIGEITGNPSDNLGFKFRLGISPTTTVMDHALTQCPAGAFVSDYEVFFTGPNSQTVVAVTTANGIAPIVTSAKWTVDMTVNGQWMDMLANSTSANRTLRIHTIQSYIRGI